MMKSEGVKKGRKGLEKRRESKDVITKERLELVVLTFDIEQL